MPNTAPTATNLAAPENFTEDTPLNLTNIVITDPDTGTAITARLTLSDLAAGALSTGTSGAVTSTFANGVWTASGAVANVNALLAGVTFNPAANYNGNFSIATSVSDGIDSPVTGSKAMTGAAVNDAPVAVNRSAPETYIEDTALNLTDIVVSDIDSATVTVKLTLSARSAGTLSTGTSGAVTSTFASGVWTASGAIADVNALLAGVTFNPAANVNANFRIDTWVSDGAAAITGGKTMTGTAVNDAPSATNLNAAEPYTEDTARNLTNIVVTDPDAGDTITARLTLSDLAAGTITTGTSGTVTSTFANGVWTASGAVANVNVLLAAATFAPAANYNGNFSIATWVSDGIAAPLTGSKAMTGAAVNDAPTATNRSAPETYAEDTPLNLTDIVITDPDTGNNITARLTLSDPAAGTLSTGTSGAVTSTFTSGVWTASGAVADVNNLLAGVTFTPVPDYSSNFSIATWISDGVAPALTGNKAMTGTAGSGNDAPSATNLGAAETYTEDTPLNLTDIVVSDMDSANVTATLTLSDTSAGTLSTATSGAVTSTFAAGVWTASGAVADVNALLAAVTFNPALNFNSNFTIATSVSDGVAPAVTGSKAMTGTPVNDAPVNTVPDVQTATEDTNLTVNGISIADVDATGPMQVTLSSANGALTLSQSTGLTFTAGDGTADAAMTFTGTLGNVNSALAGLIFRGNLNFNGAAGITLVTSDQGSAGSGGTLSDTDSIAVNVTAVNDAPTATNVSAAETYTADTPLNLTDIMVSDVDSANVAATLTLSNVAAGSLSTATSGTVTSTYDAGTGAWAASGAIADVNALLAGVTFNPAENFNSSFTIATSVSDGIAAPITGSKAVTAVVVNLPPIVFNLIPNQTYAEDTPLNLNDIVLTDLDSANVTAMLTLSNVAAGSLSTATSGAVTSTYNAGTGVWAASGTVANVNALLAAVTFNPALNFNSNFTIATSVSDGVAPAVTGSKAMTGTPVNDAPVNTVPDVQTATEDTNLTVNGISIADVDATGPMQVTLSSANGALTLSQSTGLTFTAGDGTADAAMTFTGTLGNVNSALAGLIFRGNLNFNGAAGITLVTSDQGSAGSGGTLSDTDSIAVNVTAVNDAPTATNLSAAETYTEDTARNLTDIVVADVDNPNLSVTLTLSNTAAGTLSTGTSGAVTSTFAAGVWTASGAIANVNALLAGVTFNPAANFNSGFSITSLVSDGNLTANGTKAFTGVAVNDAPVNIVPGSQSAAVGANKVISGISVSDPDAGSAIITMTLAVTAGGGTITVNSSVTYGVGSGSITGNGTASVVLTGTISQINTTLGNATGVIYNSGAFAGAATITVSSNDQGATPGPAQIDADTISVTVGGGGASINLTTLNGATGFKIDGERGTAGNNSGDFFGHSVSGIGDFNGDGRADLLIGAPNFDAALPFQTVTNEGRSYVVFGAGSPTALAAGSFNGGNGGFKLISVDTSGQGATAFKFGNTVGAGSGDINGDGLSDLLGGVRSGQYAQTVHGIMGATSLAGLSGASTTVGFNVQTVNGTNGFKLTSSASSFLGSQVQSLASGDLNNDGRADTVFGEQQQRPGGLTNAGQVAVVRGTASTSSLNNLLVDGTTDNGTLKFNGPTANSKAGTAVATGDVNGDGIADLIVGAPGSGLTAAKVYVVFGGTSLANLITNNATSHILDTGFDLSTLNGTTGYIVSDGTFSTKLGFALASGDVNGDGIDDIVMGAPSAYANGQQGVAYVLYGHRGAQSNVNLSTITGTQGIKITHTGDNRYSQLGYSVAVAPGLNGDGFDDVVLGAVFFQAPGSTQPDGRAYVVFGGAGLGNTDVNAMGTSGGLVLTGQLGQTLPVSTGVGVAGIGNFNADAAGYTDIAIGAQGARTATTDAGQVYVLYGSDFSGQGTAPQTLNASANDANLIGRPGNDTLSNNTRLGVVMKGGAGNDQLTVDAQFLGTSTSGKYGIADGGGGFDTLVLNLGSGQGLNFNSLAARSAISGIEKINLNGSSQSLTLDLRDVLDVTDPQTAQAIAGSSHQLFVSGSATNSVTVTAGQFNSTSAGTFAGPDGHTYNIYVPTNAAIHATLLVDQLIPVANIHL